MTLFDNHLIEALRNKAYRIYSNLPDDELGRLLLILREKRKKKEYYSKESMRHILDITRKRKWKV